MCALCCRPLIGHPGESLSLWKVISREGNSLRYLHLDDNGLEMGRQRREREMKGESEEKRERAMGRANAKKNRE